MKVDIVRKMFFLQAYAVTKQRSFFYVDRVEVRTRWTLGTLKHYVPDIHNSVDNIEYFKAVTISKLVYRRTLKK
jgi:hypothetical protein